MAVGAAHTNEPISRSLLEAKIASSHFWPSQDALKRGGGQWCGWFKSQYPRSYSPRYSSGINGRATLWSAKVRNAATRLLRVSQAKKNVKAVLSKVSLGEADAGVVYSTDFQTAADKLTSIQVPDNFNIIATYPIAAVKGSANSDLAQKWIAYVLSPDGQAVLAKYGFISPM